MYKRFGFSAGLLLGAISIVTQCCNGLFVGASFLTLFLTVLIYLLMCSLSGLGIGAFLDWLYHHK